MNVAYLMSADAVRERCAIILEAAEQDRTPHFKLFPERLGDVACHVADITRRRYPDLNVPFHSRWRHFSVGGIDRTAEMVTTIRSRFGADRPFSSGDLDAAGINRGGASRNEAARNEIARAKIELAIVSVLLDADAGPDWCYYDRQADQVFSRSEGLAVASFRAMQSGLFSDYTTNPWRADAVAIATVATTRIFRAFQCGAENRPLGFDGRVALLCRMGGAADCQRELFGDPGRLGRLFDHFRRAGTIEAADILKVLLIAFAEIWPGRIQLEGMPLGDCGRHSLIPGDGVVPFHKLSQWMTYSLIEPLQEAGIAVTGLDRLTGLAEYRNGGLFIDLGVLKPRDRDLPNRILDPTSEPVVEWRALTVALLDRLAPLVRQQLGLSAEQFPLAKILEGGTWAAGRELAKKLRNGNPPLEIISDGTLF